MNDTPHPPRPFYLTRAALTGAGSQPSSEGHATPEEVAQMRASQQHSIAWFRAHFRDVSVRHDSIKPERNKDK
jgi:hypothetical protein